MNLTPIEFITAIKQGKTEKELNRKESNYIDPAEFNKLTKKYGHTIQSATDHLLTDYSNGFTICANCGSYYHLGNGFTKHLSNGCLNCEGESKHRVYYVNASKPSEGGYKERYMCLMFDDGLHYVKDRLSKEQFFNEIPIIKTN